MGLATVTRAAQVYGDANVVLFVAELRLQNKFYKEMEAVLKAREVEDNVRGADLFSNRAFGSPEIERELIGPESDQVMLEYCLSCLEHLIEIVPRIKLVFWDTFFRDHLIRASNISTRVRGAVSFHRNLYRNLVERYPGNV